MEMKGYLISEVESMDGNFPRTRPLAVFEDEGKADAFLLDKKKKEDERRNCPIWRKNPTIYVRKYVKHSVMVHYEGNKGGE